jgi:hypothetical protein
MSTVHTPSLVRRVVAPCPSNTPSLVLRAADPGSTEPPSLVQRVRTEVTAGELAKALETEAAFHEDATSTHGGLKCVYFRTKLN